MTKQCSKCQKATNGVKVDKGTWLCWECFQKFYSERQESEVNIKDIEVKHKKAVKEFLKK
jgi:ribosomal protein L37AE/L43A